MNKLRTLDVPAVEWREFEHNLLALAVCELRFPHLLEFETKPPQSLQQTLRKRYPHYSTKTNVNLSVGDLKRDPRYILTSKKKDWTVTFGPYSLSLETTSYKTFEDFWDRFKEVLDAAAPIIDTDFFTRVGLRYQNAINVDPANLEGWINSDLITPLISGVYGSVTEFNQNVRGPCQGGFYTFRHGVGTKDSGTSVYVLDSDFYAEDVEKSELVRLAKTFSDQNYRLFRWAIGEKALDSMGPSKPNPRR